MYRRILVALDNSPADENLVKHVSALAKFAGAELLLVHVSHGFAAQYYDSLKLSESQEMQANEAYLREVTERIAAQGVSVTARHPLGNPADEILRVAKQENCDLLAMGGHGHRFFADLFLGSTVESIRHSTSIPILVVGPSR